MCIDLEKLTLSKKKCHNIHIGKPNVKCPALKVYGNKMENFTLERYLGDIVHNSGTLTLIKESQEDMESQVKF